MASDRRLIAVLLMMLLAPSPGRPGENSSQGAFAQETVVSNDPQPSPVPVYGERQTKNWQVVHLPGIGGMRSIDQYMIRGLTIGLQSRNLHVESKIYDWTEDEDGLLALSDSRLHARQSKKVADLIATIRRKHPDDILLLTSHSAGTGIAAWALAELPADVRVDRWLLLSSALSFKFDLTDALMHVQNEAFAFNSLTDLVVGTGTKLFGTVDRVNTDSGGRVGFTQPLFGDPLAYLKLHNVPYESGWMHYANDGDHIGTMTMFFARNVLAPTVVNDQVPTTRPALP